MHYPVVGPDIIAASSEANFVRGIRMEMSSKDKSLETSLIFNVFQLTFIILYVSGVDRLSGPPRPDDGMPPFNKWRSHNRDTEYFFLSKNGIQSI